MRGVGVFLFCAEVMGSRPSIGIFCQGQGQSEQHRVSAIDVQAVRRGDARARRFLRHSRARRAVQARRWRGRLKVTV